MRRIYLLALLVSLMRSKALAEGGDDPASLYARADIVFTGRLEKLSLSPSGLNVRFEVAQRIKGKTGANKYLRALLPIESDCHALEENHTYLVYGRRIGNQLWIDPCEGSKLMSLAERDLRYIHSVDPEVSEQCNRSRLAQIARDSQIVVTAEVMGTEDTLGSPPFFRPWCGLAFTTEDAYYRVIEVFKGEVSAPNIAVEHVICWDTVTVGGYSPTLSPELFKQGNVLLLFLNAGSHQPDRQRPLPFLSAYEDTDENCGAVEANDQVALSIAEAMRATPENYKRRWLDEDIDCLIGADGEASCACRRINDVL